MKHPTPLDDLTILDSQAAFMQRVCDYVRAGYVCHTSGVAGADRLATFVQRMDLKFQVVSDKHQRLRRKRVELGNAVLLMLRDFKSDQIEWILLVTSPEHGSHPAHVQEKLRHAFKDGLTFHGYELARETVKGRQKPVWTWRMEKETYLTWRDAIVETVRSGNKYQMGALLMKLYKSPGFSGIRRQVGLLATLYRAEVKQRKVENAPKPSRSLGYVRRLKDRGASVRQTMKAAKGGAA